MRIYATVPEVSAMIGLVAGMKSITSGDSYRDAIKFGDWAFQFCEHNMGRAFSKSELVLAVAKFATTKMGLTIKEVAA